ncbi:hypothetical protein MPH_07742 [Macrophomina phaseolina MS6]|uniref:Uncharacterized protein n=1 Tax=Macrophomina phaseolina (strain MS6) TaxID=1126212 RepID=K2RY17_MACPH|nr:hypothetical protein MPH_07742 [Macrophomina phaseolina MS6]
MCILSWAGYDWRSTSIRHSSPDTVSPLYPDRPIRPLPKRRLRARLSPEQADSITYPTPPVGSPPVFDFPYTHPDKVASISTRQQRGEKEHKCSCGADHSEPESEEDDDERLATGGLSSSVSKPLPPGSASSADGYESFENTNNKKKRKIPVSGSAGHHGNLTAEMASMGISTHSGDGAHDGENNVGQYYGSGSSAMPAPGSGTGISGAGRGRYGRSAARSSNERRPLGASTSSLNAYANGGAGRARTNGAVGNGKAANYDHGIISTAIANATAAGHTSQQDKGKENVSLLQQEAAKTTPQKTQFTFTCGSPNQPSWPSQNGAYPNATDARAPPPAPSSTGPPSASRIPLPTQPNRSTNGTQTSPQMNGAQQPVATGQPASPPGPNAQQGAPQQPKKPRRRPEKIYAMAARRRRLQQEYTNYHHPPSRDEIWICEFCEYEDIFGEPPRALIQQYEIKDRKEQKRMAEKRRLLEKAKMKGRKGKKAAKNSKNGATASNQHSQQQHAPQHGYDHQIHPDGTVEGHDEYFEDDYDDGVVHPDGDADVDGGYVPPPADSEPPDDTLISQGHGHEATTDEFSEGGGTAHGDTEPAELGKGV